MNTKTGLLAGAILLTALGFGISAVGATNDISHTLQRGLFEEEANHNLPVAIQAAYESVISQVDSNRPLAATAIFRLGEIYRRQGKTNEASTQYERVLREFPDQEELAKLSREHLPASTANATSPADSVTSVHRISRGAGQPKCLSALKETQPSRPAHPGATTISKPGAHFIDATEGGNGAETDGVEQGFREGTSRSAQGRGQIANHQPTGGRSGCGCPARFGIAAGFAGIPRLRRWRTTNPQRLAQFERNRKLNEIKRIRELIKNSPDFDVTHPQSDNQALMQSAAGKGELEVVKLSAGETGRRSTSLRQGRLHAAALSRLAMATWRLLIFCSRHGAKPNAETSSGVTPLDLALYKGYASGGESSCWQRGLRSKPK